MLILTFGALVGIASLHSWANWRNGIYWIVVIGLLQDPVRKVSPGTPAWLVLSTMPVWIVIAFRVWTSRFRPNLGTLYPRLRTAVRVFLVSIIPAALISATLGPGSWQLTVLGGMTYLTLLYSVVIGYRFARDERELRRLLGFYCVGAAVLLGGSLLEYSKVPFPGLGTEMLGHIWTRQIPGVTIYMISGFFRSPDVMGWHAATVTMIAITMVVTARWPSRWLWIAIAVWGSGIVILCGRRKMVYMLPLFVILLAWVFWWLGRRRSAALLVVFVLLISSGFLLFYERLEPDEAFMAYYTYDKGGVFTSVERHGVDAVIETVRQSGFFGAGLGSAAQGAHHLSVLRPGTWQESGPSRAMVDLGVPGFMCLAAVGVLLLRSLWLTLQSVRSSRSPRFRLWAGLFVMVLANAGAFVVSGQIFGDPFITCLLAMIIGMILGARRLESAPAPTTARDVVPLHAAAGQVRPVTTALLTPTRGQSGSE